MTDDSILATLLIREGQYELRLRSEQQGEQTKFVSPQDVAAAFRDEPSDSGWLPAGVIRAGRVRGAVFAVGWFGARRHTCGFVRPGQRLDRVEALSIPLPPLVFAGIGREHAVWAVKEERVEPRAAAFHTPTPNVFPDGRVCWGASTPPVATAASLGTAFSLFLNAPFTGNLIDRKSRSHRGDVRNLLRGLVGKDKFPKRELVATGHSVEQVVDQFLKHGSGR